jgi:hypothetical protein
MPYELGLVGVEKLCMGTNETIKVITQTYASAALPLCL